MIHLALWILSLMSTVKGIVGIGVLFIAAFSAAWALRLSVHVRWAIALAGLVYLSYGVAVQYGEKVCRDQQAAAVARVHKADQAQIDALQSELTAKETAYQDALSQADAYKAALDAAPGGSPGDILTQGDADEINR